MDPLLRKVDCAAEALRRVEAAGSRELSRPEDIPVGRVAVVADPFGNPLVLLDLSKGTFQAGPDGTVTGVGQLTARWPVTS